MPSEIAPNERELLIGQYCAELVEDGATIQLGIGGIPNAAAVALENKKDLGVHSEMACDTMRTLWEKGVITNRLKTLIPDRCVFTFAMGSPKLYEWINDNPGIIFRSVSWVNDPYVIGLMKRWCPSMAPWRLTLPGRPVRIHWYQTVYPSRRTIGFCQRGLSFPGRKINPGL